MAQSKLQAESVCVITAPVTATVAKRYSEPHTTRRTFLGGATTVPVILLLPALAHAASHPDAEIIRAFEERRDAFARYNALPIDNDCPDDMEPEEQACWDIIDAADVKLHAATARTPRGACLQLMAALSHGLTAKRETDAADTADLSTLLALEADMDWRERMFVSALRSLNSMGGA